MANGLYHLVKLGVGLLLMGNFALPLVVVFRNEALWDEPMVLLVTNLAAADFALGFTAAAIGVADIVFERMPPPLCSFIMFSSVGAAVAMKLAHVWLALDQFVAVSFPLRYYELMENITKRLLMLTGLLALLHLVIGMIMFYLGLETQAEEYQRINNDTQILDGCRWETTIPSSYMITFEVEIFCLAFTAAGLFIYTGFVGLRHQSRIQSEHLTDAADHQLEKRFFTNFRAFKKIIRVILLTLLLDGLSVIPRIASRWYPMPLLNGLLHQLRLSLIVIEGWTYGLLNARMRAAYGEFIGCGLCCGPAAEGAVAPAPEPADMPEQGGIAEPGVAPPAGQKQLSLHCTVGAS
ncbi:melanopsin-like [Pollicipes pollicipes]|uniref:melanopsin-like n=1 Tax=Pollicipes pollicipes TaxID=41117 RepID=UPI0018859E56|nr:melanopsin-like [Pollicipes pollicipes]